MRAQNCTTTCVSLRRVLTSPTRSRTKRVVVMERSFSARSSSCAIVFSLSPRFRLCREGSETDFASYRSAHISHTSAVSSSRKGRAGEDALLPCGMLWSVLSSRGACAGRAPRHRVLIFRQLRALLQMFVPQITQQKADVLHSGLPASFFAGVSRKHKPPSVQATGFPAVVPTAVTPTTAGNTWTLISHEYHPCLFCDQVKRQAFQSNAP